MRNIVLTIISLITISFFMGCGYEDITSSDGSGNVYDFWVGDINIHYERDGHSGLGTAYNPTTYRARINVKECDARCDERQGISFTLDERYQTHSWRAYYEPGGKVKITIEMDGVYSINTVRLQKTLVNDKHVDIYIEDIKMKIGSFDDEFDGIETDDVDLADYTEFTFIIDIK